MPLKWTAKGEGGAVGAAKRAWVQGNPCYLCRKFGHRARDHKEMPRGNWPPEDVKRWETRQIKWGEIKDLIMSGYSRGQVAESPGVNMTDSAALHDEEFLALLLARLTGLPDWETGQMPLYVSPNVRRSSPGQGDFQGPVPMTIEQSDSSSTPPVRTTAPLPVKPFALPNAAFTAIAHSRSSPRKRKLRKLRESGPAEDKKHLQVAFNSAQPLNLQFGDGSVPPSPVMQKPKVSVEMQHLEDRVTSVEKDIKVMKDDSAVTLKLLTMSAACR